jgi:hypothetical protein
MKKTLYKLVVVAIAVAGTLPLLKTEAGDRGPTVRSRAVVNGRRAPIVREVGTPSLRGPNSRNRVVINGERSPDPR